MYTGIHVKNPLLLSDFAQAWSFWPEFLKSSNIKFHENPSSRSEVVQRGLADTTKLTVVFHDFANRRKTKQKCSYSKTGRVDGTVFVKMNYENTTGYPFPKIEISAVKRK